MVRDMGGLGDIVRILGVAEALVRRGDDVTFCCDKTYVDACELCPSVANGSLKLIPWDIRSVRGSLGPLARTWGQLQHLPYVVGPFSMDTRVADMWCPALMHEVATGGRPSLSRTRCWAAAAGVDNMPPGSVRAEVPARFVPDAMAWRRSIGRHRPVVAISPASNASIRTWRNGVSSTGRTGAVGGLVAELRKRGIGTVAFSSDPLDVIADSISVHADVRVQAARIAQCDCFVGPDSGMLNLACALGVATVGLFGPTHARLVLECYDNVQVNLSGKWDPSITKTIGCERPCYGLVEGGYNTTKCRGRCAVLEGVAESRVADAIEGLVSRRTSLVRGRR